VSTESVDSTVGVGPQWPRIRKDMDTVGGAARIAGTRVRVSDIVVDHQYHGLTPEEIADEYSTVSLSEVYAGLSYFADHTAEIREEIQDREQELGGADADGTSRG